MQKIAEASVQLDELNAKLALQKVVVAQKTEACEALLAKISVGESCCDKVCLSCLWVRMMCNTSSVENMSFYNYFPNKTGALMLQQGPK